MQNNRKHRNAVRRDKTDKRKMRVIQGKKAELELLLASKNESILHSNKVRILIGNLVKVKLCVG